MLSWAPLDARHHDHTKDIGGRRSDGVVPIKGLWNNMDVQWRQRPGLPRGMGPWSAMRLRGRGEREGQGRQNDTYPRMSALSPRRHLRLVWLVAYLSMRLTK